MRRTPLARSRGCSMATRKKPPTRKQLAARKKFVAMVRRRAREARAAKRAAGIRRPATKRAVAKKRNVAMGFRDSAGRFHPIRASEDYSDARAGAGRLRSKRRAASKSKLRSKARPTGALRAASRIAAKRKTQHKTRVRMTRHNPVSVTKNGRKLYGAAALAVLKKRNSAWDLSKPTTRKKYVDRSYRGRGSKAHRRKYGTSTPEGMSWGQTPRMKRKLPNPVSVVKNGRRLYGAAALAVLKSRAKRKNPKDFLSTMLDRPTTRKKYVDRSYRGRGSKAHRRRYGTSTPKGVVWRPESTMKRRLPNRGRNGILRTAARQAISKRLTQPIRFGRRRNSAPAGIEAMHETFLGRGTVGYEDITAPQGTPKDVAVLGNLVCLKTEDEDFIFDKGEAYLGADERGNLYVLGDTTPVETNTNFGHIEEIRYEAKKDHINPFRWRRRAKRNSGNVEYFHYFGEETGVMPKLKSDGDGALHISGGNYTIEPEGITD